MHYEIIVRPDDTQFRAICPQLPGVVGYGATAGLALDAAMAALTKRLELAQHDAPSVIVVRAELRTTNQRS